MRSRWKRERERNTFHNDRYEMTRVYSYSLDATIVFKCIGKAKRVHMLHWKTMIVSKKIRFTRNCQELGNDSFRITLFLLIDPETKIIRPVTIERWPCDFKASIMLKMVIANNFHGLLLIYTSIFDHREFQCHRSLGLKKWSFDRRRIDVMATHFIISIMVDQRNFVDSQNRWIRWFNFAQSPKFLKWNWHDCTQIASLWLVNASFKYQRNAFKLSETKFDFTFG